MSETTADSPSGTATTGELEQRLDRVESTLGEIKAMIAGGEHQAHDAAAEHTQQRLERPTAIADEVRQQLDEREARRAEGDRLAAVETDVATLKETRPEPPIRWVERKMGWR